MRTSLWLLVFVAAGTFIAVAYNLELFGGRFHGDPWFSLAWGAFPVLATYFAAPRRFASKRVLAAAFAALLSHAQRRLSTPVRLVRRRARAVSGRIELIDGSTIADHSRDLHRRVGAGTAGAFRSRGRLALALVLLRVT